MTERTALTVGEVAERFGVTVRTLHYYDEIGLLRPSRRSPAGYRQYTEADLTRLQHVVVYRRLGFALETIADLLDDPAADVAEHLRRQRIAVTARLDEMRDLVTAIDNALEVHMSGTPLTEAERRELFGPHHDEYAAEAEQRWGHTEAWAQSQQRTARYTKEDWVAVKAEADAATEAIAAAMRSGLPAVSPEAMDAAEAHRRHIHDRFYDLSYDMHRCLGDMYVTDVRFMRNYDDVEPGLAQYLRDAIHANADRQRARAAFPPRSRADDRELVAALVDGAGVADEVGHPLQSVRSRNPNRTQRPWPLGEWLHGIRPRSLRKTCWRTTATTASFPEAVRENEEVVPVNAVSTWVLPSGVTVGR